MIKDGGIPVCGVVTVLTGIVGCDVGRPLGAQYAFAGRCGSVVACEARRDRQFSVVKGRCRNEGRRVVAALAGIGRLHMFA